MAEGIFLRIETYARHRSRRARSRRATVSDLIAEIDRAPASSKHVDDIAPPSHKGFAGPRPPTVIRGDRPRDVKRRVCREVSKTADERGRAPRRDQRVLAGYVVSAPVTPSRYESDPAAKEAVDRYFERSLMFLERYLAKTGGEIASAVAHVDESYVHMHVLAIPSRVPGYHADALHPAKAAEQAARAQGAAPRTARAQGQAALKTFLDRFYAEVGDQFGLVRRTSDMSRPRVARRQIVEERRHRNEDPPKPERSEPAMSTPETAEAGGNGAWRLDDFVAGADALLASLSPDWRCRGSAQASSHEPDNSATGSATVPSPGYETST